MVMNCWSELPVFACLLPWDVKQTEASCFSNVTVGFISDVTQASDRLHMEGVAVGTQVLLCLFLVFTLLFADTD